MRARIAHRRSSALRCPYCHGALDGIERESPCPACAARHHEECSIELTRCAVFACGARRIAPVHPRWRFRLTIAHGFAASVLAHLLLALACSSVRYCRCGHAQPDPTFRLALRFEGARLDEPPARSRVLARWPREDEARAFPDEPIARVG